MGETQSEIADLPPAPSHAAQIAGRFRRNRGAMFGLGLAAVFFLAAFTAPLLANNLPFVFTAGGATSYPLVREFFAPQATTEPVLESLFNYGLLFLPLCALILRGLRPGWWSGCPLSPRGIALALGAAAAVAGAAGLGWLLWPSAADGAALPPAVALASLGESPWTAAARLGTFLICAPGWLWICLAGAAQAAAGPRWLIVALLAALLAIPFLTVRPIHHPDAASFRKEIAAGRATGLMPPLPYGPRETGFGPRLPPCWWQVEGKAKKKWDKPGVHWLGTDSIGRDLAVRSIHGARVSLAVGLLAVLLATIIGLAIGAASGYFGGLVDLVAQRLLEIMMCFPTYFLILAIIATMDRRSILNIMLVIGLTGWTGVARLVRGEVLKQRALDYVASAVALGAGPARIIFRHILPNALAPVLVSVTFGIAGAILTEAGLSFLGFGVAPPTPTWGVVLNEARMVGPLDHWWLAIFPGVLIFLSVTAYNLVGEGLRDAMDPRWRD